MGNAKDRNTNGIVRNRTNGPSFTTLVGRITRSEDPAVVGAPANRGGQTHTRQDTLIGNTPLSPGLQVRDFGAVTAQTATFTVAANIFTGASWVIRLGDRNLRLHLDWAPGATTDLTAQAIVDAVLLVGQGWSAARALSVVTVTYEGGLVDARFEIVGSMAAPVTLPAGTDITFADTNPDTIVRNDFGDFIFDGWLEGMEVTVSNATNPANDGVFTIDTGGVLNGDLTLIGADALTASANDVTASLSAVLPTNFSAISPADGWMAAGSPRLQAAVVTP